MRPMFKLFMLFFIRKPKSQFKNLVKFLWKPEPDNNFDSAFQGNNLFLIILFLNKNKF